MKYIFPFYFLFVSIGVFLEVKNENLFKVLCLALTIKQQSPNQKHAYLIFIQKEKKIFKSFYKKNDENSWSNRSYFQIYFSSFILCARFKSFSVYFYRYISSLSFFFSFEFIQLYNKIANPVIMQFKCFLILNFSIKVKLTNW